MTTKIKAWIKETRDESQKLLQEAEKARDDSDYSDIDALEQSAYNEGVLETLRQLEEIVKDFA